MEISNELSRIFKINSDFMKNRQIIIDRWLNKGNQVTINSELNNDGRCKDYLTEWSLVAKTMENEKAINDKFINHPAETNNNYKHFF